MGRKARFDKEHFVRAALEILSEGGPGDVTMQAVAARASGPVGSLYHRFPSRDHLMAELWITLVNMFQGPFLKRLAAGDIEGAALHTPRWVRSHPAEARVLLLYRRETFMTGDWPEDMKVRVARLARDLEDGIRAFTRRRYGRSGGKGTIRVQFALIDAPFAAVRRYLHAGGRVPKMVDRLVLETVAAILEEKI